MKSYLSENPKLLMKKHGKTFYFASQVFPNDQFENIATLYAFCRYVDDLADELAPEKSLVELNKLKKSLISGEYPEEVKDLIESILSKGVKVEYLLELLAGALFDVNQGKILTRKDLLVYCYQVAGVVGLMMCPLLGVKRNKAYSHAIDLGIGMQLTNISRDILEDAQNDRYYLPQNELEAYKISKTEIIKSSKTPDHIKSLVKDLLETANFYYESARKGFSFIPWRARIAILLASEIYRAIGVKIAKNDYEVLQGRTFLSKREKIFVTLKSLRFLFSSCFWIEKTHSKNLHHLISHLPETNNGGN